MKTVIQEDSTGCGIACAAMLARKGYQEVKKRAVNLGIFVEDADLYSHTRHLRTLLESYNITIGKKKIPFTDWNRLPAVAILAIKFKEKERPQTWHWVVYLSQGDKRVVLDPNKNLKVNRRTDFGRMKPKWYITVKDI